MEEDFNKFQRDIDPSYDDDFNDDDSDEDDEEDFITQETEKILDKKEIKTDYFNTTSMQNSPFGTSYGSQGYQPQSPWANTINHPSSTPPWATPKYQPSYTPSFGNSSTLPWQQNNTPAYGGDRKIINRSKKIIFCDLLDNLIESIQSNGKLGMHPRGIFDIRLKFEVWDKIGCFSPDYIFVLTNQNIVPDTVQAKVYRTMTEYVMYSLAEYLRLPYENCQCLTKAGFDIGNPLTKPGTGLIKKALSSIPDSRKKYKKEDMLVIGAMSGLAGQSNRDSEMANNFKIDYIDIGQLLNLYF